MEEKYKIQKDDIINVPPHLQQQILRLVGMADSTYLGNDIYYRLRIVDLLIEFVGEDVIEKRMKKEGKDWNKIKHELERVSKKVARVKPVYDLIEDKKFADISKDSDSKNKFIKEVSRIPLVNNPVIKMYIWLFLNTNMHRFTVNSEYYKIIEHSGYKTFQTPKKPFGMTIRSE